MSRVPCPAFFFSLIPLFALLFLLVNKVIIIGASQGIGLGLAKLISNEGHTLGLTARSIDTLRSEAGALPGKVFTKYMDVTQVEESRNILSGLIEEMGGMDLFIYNAGIYIAGTKWENDRQVLSTNAYGFLALTTWAYEYFEKQGSGQIVGISSVSHLRGMSVSPVYGASKAFMSNYLEGLSLRVQYKKQNITVTDIIPGYIDTGLTQGGKRKIFWVLSLHSACKWIWRAIKQKKRRKVINLWWRLTHFGMARAPWFIYKIFWK